MADRRIQEAVDRGEFDNLPGAGKPLTGLDGADDPDWWLRSLVEREQITIIPASVQLRRDDAALDELLDAQPDESEARRVLEEFNQRVLHARYSYQGGPPLVTATRDLDSALQQWRHRRERRWQQPARTGSAHGSTPPTVRHGWRLWRRRRQDAASTTGGP